MSKINGYSFNIATPFKLLANMTASGATNSTSEVKLLSLFVPAGTYTAGDVVRVETIYKKVGITSGQTVRIYWNTADSIVSPTPITVGYDTRAASNLIIPIIRHLSIAVAAGTGDGTQVSNTTVLSQQDIAVPITSSPETKAINWNSDGYLIAAGAVTSASDTLACQWIKLTNG